jgi:Integrase core domain
MTAAGQSRSFDDIRAMSGLPHASGPPRVIAVGLRSAMCNVESFNARLRDELLNGESFYTLREAQIVIESWRRHYNTIRPYASLGYKPPAPEVFLPAFAAWPAALTWSAARLASRRGWRP